MEVVKSLIFHNEKCIPSFEGDLGLLHWFLGPIYLSKWHLQTVTSVRIGIQFRYHQFLFGQDIHSVSVLITWALDTVHASNIKF